MGILLTQLHIYTMEIICQLRVLIFFCERAFAALVSVHSYLPLHRGSLCIQCQGQILSGGNVQSVVTNK